MAQKLGKVLLVRLDRIGDLVMTFPVDESLSTLDSKADVRWWIPPGLAFIAAHAEPRRNVRELARQFNYLRFRMLLDELRRDPPRLAIIFHAPWWVSLLFFLARVPVRAGPRSQWHHFLFLNRRVKQKRSRAEKSELEYNFQLLERSLNLGAGWLRRSRLKLTPPASAPFVLEGFGLEPGGYIVVHPGMRGSARNWPIPMWAQLIQRLTEQNRVVITGTRGDAPYTQPIREMLSGNSNVVWLENKLNGPDLLSVLGYAKAVIAPSTGVLHLAASLGVPTLGLFSPVKVQSARRWGPHGNRTRVLIPEVDCPGIRSCLGEKCKEFDCMQKIDVSSVQSALAQLLAPGGSPSGTSGSGQLASASIRREV